MKLSLTNPKESYLAIYCNLFLPPWLEQQQWNGLKCSRRTTKLNFVRIFKVVVLIFQGGILVHENTHFNSRPPPPSFRLLYSELLYGCSSSKAPSIAYIALYTYTIIQSLRTPVKRRRYQSRSRLAPCPDPGPSSTLCHVIIWMDARA